MAKKLCPICKVNTFGGLFGMVAKDGEFCGKCWDKLYEIKGQGCNAKEYTISEIAQIINATNFDASVLERNNTSQTVQNNSENKSLFGSLKDAAIRKKQDMAVARAYKEEQDKRKPRIETLKHERALTMEEQAMIDRIEMEIAQIKGRNMDKSLQGGNVPLFSQEIFNLQMKKQEILDRCITYEEIVHPPLIDPSIPIEIDEEAIRNSIKTLL